MSDLPAADRDAMEEATRLLTLAKSQRGMKKQLTEGHSYLVITMAYLHAYGDILPANDKEKMVGEWIR
jgi:hypothetical protein